MPEAIEKTSQLERQEKAPTEQEALEKRADYIIDAAIKAVFEINKKINKELEKEHEGTLEDEAHKKNPLDEAHILELELHYPDVDPLIAMLEDLEEPLLGKVEKLIATGNITSDDRKTIKEAIIEHLAHYQENA